MSKNARCFELGGPVDPLGSDFDSINAERTARWAADAAAEKGVRGPATGYQSYSGAEKTKPLGALDQNAFNRMLGNSLLSLLAPKPAALRQPGVGETQPLLAFAEGGRIDPDELLRRMSSKYGVSSGSQPAPQPAQPQPAPQPIAQPQPGSSLLTGAANAMRGRAAQIDKAAGYAQGGKIQGPGTATSDSIPAKVRETGEDIMVSNTERIVSAKQEALLQRIAQLLGFDSVDALLEAGTGEPVGPTIKAGKKAAVTGASPYEQGIEKMRSQLAPQQPAPDVYRDVSLPDGFMASTLAASKEAGNAAQAAFQAGNPGAGAGQLLRGVGTSAIGLVDDTMRGAARVLDPAANALKTLVTGDSTPARPLSVAAKPPAAQLQAAPAPAEAVPVQAPAPAAEPMSPLLAPTADRLTTRDITAGGYTDRGAGVVGSRDARGQLNVTKGSDLPSLDSSASALIDQKNSTYNPAAQLERMQRSRLMSDLTNPEITDPAVRQQAALALGLINQGAKANLENAQADQAQALTAQTQQMEQMRGKLLDPNTSPEERARMIQALQAITGKQAGYKVATTSTPNPNGFGPNLQQAWMINEADGTARNVEETARGTAAPSGQKTISSAQRLQLEAALKERGLKFEDYAKQHNITVK